MLTTTEGTYIVAAGDTFYSIARRHSCTMPALVAHNERPDFTLHIGEALRVPFL
ncbi:MAG: LysM domain-containing protein [Hymenobacter sp.]